MSESKPTKCAHEFVVDRIVNLGGWSNMTKMVIYCKHCGVVSYDKYL